MNLYTVDTCGQQKSTSVNCLSYLSNFLNSKNAGNIYVEILCLSRNLVGFPLSFFYCDNLIMFYTDTSHLQ